MKIAIFFPRNADGGMLRSTINLATEFARQNHTTTLITVGDDTSMLDSLPRNLIHVRLRTGRTLMAIPRLALYLRSNRPEVLISVQSYGNLAALAASKLARVHPFMILSERVSTVNLANETGLAGRWMPRLMKSTYGSADAVVANSQDGAAELASFLGWRATDVMAIYNPTLDATFEGLSAVPISHPWFEPDSPPVILGVGRLAAQKDFETLIEAFAIIRQMLECRLVILGEGDDRDSLGEQARRLGIENSVDMPGWIGNVLPYMKRAALFVLSSKFEGLPNALIEAQASGVPTLSTNCPTGPREILMDGSAGLLVSVGDSQAMADSAIRILTDDTLRASLIKTATANLFRFTASRSYDEYMSLIGRV